MFPLGNILICIKVIRKFRIVTSDDKATGLKKLRFINKKPSMVVDIKLS
jgi:hypothetical protein